MYVNCPPQNVITASSRFCDTGRQGACPSAIDFVVERVPLQQVSLDNNLAANVLIPLGALGELMLDGFLPLW